MREQAAVSLMADVGHELLTTGEAAALLGVSRQHIVDLCNVGELPYSWSGKHRRIRRGDVDLVAAGNRRITRDQARSLFLAHAIAGHVVEDPDRARALTGANLARMKASSSRGAAKVWIKEWERLLDGPLLELLAALTSPSSRSRELRQNNPFAGLLTNAERNRVLASAQLAK
jgi:excisionase family DNA binding protein